MDGLPSDFYAWGFELSVGSQREPRDRQIRTLTKGYETFNSMSLVLFVSARNLAAFFEI